MNFFLKRNNTTISKHLYEKCSNNGKNIENKIWEENKRTTLKFGCLAITKDLTSLFAAPVFLGTHNGMASYELYQNFFGWFFTKVLSVELKSYQILP